MDANSSPKPIFETDEESTYFLTVIPAHALADKSFVKSKNQSKLSGFESLGDIVRYVNKEIDNQGNDVGSDQVSDQVNDYVSDYVTSKASHINSQVKTILEQEVSPLAEKIFIVLSFEF
jgi:ATP-dependent DNA helicase RecG